MIGYNILPVIMLTSSIVQTGQIIYNSFVEEEAKIPTNVDWWHEDFTKNFNKSKRAAKYWTDRIGLTSSTSEKAQSV